MDLIVLLHLLFVNYYLIGEMKSTNAKILKALVFMHSNCLKIRFVTEVLWEPLLYSLEEVDIAFCY